MFMALGFSISGLCLRFCQMKWESNLEIYGFEMKCIQKTLKHILGFGRFCPWSYMFYLTALSRRQILWRQFVMSWYNICVSHTNNASNLALSPACVKVPNFYIQKDSFKNRIYVFRSKNKVERNSIYKLN